MFKLDILDALSDSELDQVEVYSQALKKKRDEERKAKAMEQAKAILAAAGINLKDLSGKGRTKAAKGPAYRAGQQYQHPTNRALVWNGKGKSRVG